MKGQSGRAVHGLVCPHPLPRKNRVDGPVPDVFTRLYLNLYSKKFKRNKEIRLAKQANNRLNGIDKNTNIPRQKRIVGRASSRPVQVHQSVRRVIKFSNTTLDSASEEEWSCFGDIEKELSESEEKFTVLTSTGLTHWPVYQESAGPLSLLLAADAPRDIDSDDECVAQAKIQGFQRLVEAIQDFRAPPSIPYFYY